jgi:tetratricopeptide (TPR) repeat protein
MEHLDPTPSDPATQATTPERAQALAELRDLVFRHEIGLADDAEAIDFAVRVVAEGAPLADSAPLWELACLDARFDDERQRATSHLERARAELLSDFEPQSESARGYARAFFVSLVRRYLHAESRPRELLLGCQAMVGQYAREAWLLKWVDDFDRSCCAHFDDQQGRRDIVHDDVGADEVPWLAEVCRRALAAADVSEMLERCKRGASEADRGTAEAELGTTESDRVPSIPDAQPEPAQVREPPEVALFASNEGCALVRVHATAQGGSLRIDLVSVGTDGRRWSLNQPWGRMAMLERQWVSRAQGWRLDFDPTLVAAGLKIQAVDNGSFALPSALAMLDDAHARLAAGRRAPARAAWHRPPKEAARGEAMRAELDAAEHLNRMGRKVRDAGSLFDVAELMFRAALDARLRWLGDDYLSAVSRNDLGLLLREKEEHEEAFARFRDAHLFFVDHHDERHSDYVTTLHNCGATLIKLGRASEGFAALRRALHLHREHRRTPQLEVSNTCWVLGVELARQGELDEAVQLLEDAVKLRRRAGAQHPVPMAELLAAYGQALRNVRGMQAAEPILREAIGIFERELGPAHRLTREWVDYFASIGGRR